MLRFLTVLSFVAFSYKVYSQAPRILSLDKDHGAMGETVTLKGNNFGTNAAKLEVFFGGVKGTVLTATDHIVEVEVPEGATHDYISLRNVDTKLTGYSSQQFYISFSGTSDAISANDFATQQDWSTKSGSTTSDLYDFCMCDFNNDGKVDIATANKGALNYVTIHINNSTTGNISFIRDPTKDIILNTSTLHVNCGDLDGDGKYDLVATEEGNTGRLFYLKGVGDGSFSTSSIQLNSLIRHIQLADLDLDGKPEAILSNKSTNEIIILPNTSNMSTISFGTPIRVTISSIRASDGTDALQVEDIDNDNLPDIIVSPTQSADVHVLRNKSSLGNFQFDNPLTFTVPSAITGLKVGDLNNDGKADVAVSRYSLTGNQQMSILKNTSSPGAISFATHVSFDVELNQSWGLDFGDLNGDGLPDIVIPHATPSITTPSLKSKLTVLENKGGMNFQKSFIEKNDISRHARIADVDNDGKPDIVGASVDFSISGFGTIIASNVFTFRNKRCMMPMIIPEGPINVCNSDPVELTATKGGGITYQWKQDNSDISAGSNKLILTTPVEADFKVVVSSPGCAPLESNTVHVKITSPANIDPDPITYTPACTGPNSSLTLSASAEGDVLKYKWEGPAGFQTLPSSSGSASVPQNGTGLTLENAGYYKVYYLGTGDCVIKTDTKLVAIDNIPTFTISSSEGTTICADNTTTLSLTPATSGYNFDWYRRNSDNSTTQVGLSNQNYEVSDAGKYFAKITAATCNVEVNTIEIIKKAALTASFTIPSVACTNQEISFQNTTTEPEPLKYAWTFGDNQSTIEKAPKHTYSASSGYSVTLIASYADNSCASSPSVKTINILPAPPIQIVTASGKNQICKGGEVDLSVTGATINSYNWSTGESTSSIKATNAEIYKVTVTTNSGCSLTAEKALTFFDEAQITVTAEPPSVDPGDPVQLSVEGLSSPEWSPIESLSDPRSTTPIAIPVASIEYFVKGIDQNGCERTTSITVEVDPKSMVSFLKPNNFFSPNADAIDDLWNVGNIENFPSCGVTVYDEKGVKVFEAKPYNNDWNGTFKGTTLPDGVYYYIIRCDGEESTPKAGSLTLLR